MRQDATLIALLQRHQRPLLLAALLWIVWSDREDFAAIAAAASSTAIALDAEHASPR